MNRGKVVNVNAEEMKSLAEENKRKFEKVMEEIDRQIRQVAESGCVDTFVSPSSMPTNTGRLFHNNLRDFGVSLQKRGFKTKIANDNYEIGLYVSWS